MDARVPVGLYHIYSDQDHSFLNPVIARAARGHACMRKLADELYIVPRLRACTYQHAQTIQPIRSLKNVT